MSKEVTKLKNAPFILSAILILTVLVSAVFIFAGNKGSGAHVTIYSGGEAVWSGDLFGITGEKILTVVPASGDAGPLIIEGIDTSYDHYNIVRITSEGVSVTDSDCKNKICIHRGTVRSGALPIACLPNGLLITVTSDSESQADAYTY